jgi:hypothetical protein
MCRAGRADGVARKRAGAEMFGRGLGLHFAPRRQPELRAPRRPPCNHASPAGACPPFVQARHRKRKKEGEPAPPPASAACKRGPWAGWYGGGPGRACGGWAPLQHLKPPAGCRWGAPPAPHARGRVVCVGGRKGGARRPCPALTRTKTVTHRKGRQAEQHSHFGTLTASRWHPGSSRKLGGVRGRGGRAACHVALAPPHACCPPSAPRAPRHARVTPAARTWRRASTPRACGGRRGPSCS